MTESKKQRMARELDTRVRYLRLTGLDDTALFAAVANRMDDFKALMDAAGPSGMDSFAQRLPDLRHYAQLLTGIATGIQDGTIKVPK
jgi:hypothetical protein